MVSFVVSGCGLLGNCCFQDDVLKLRRGVEHKVELERAFMLKFDSNDEKLGTLGTISEQPLKLEVFNLVKSTRRTFNGLDSFRD